jgi:predicted dehydrogenase
LNKQFSRRTFLKQSASAAALSVAAVNPATSGAWASSSKPVRIGIVGVGNRGTSLLKTLLTIDNVEINALADIDRNRLGQAQSLVEKQAAKRPEGYTGTEDFRKLVLRDDLDAVITATPWEYHTPVAVAAMRAGKYAATEVPAALTVEQCWELVNTSEATRVPCMMLENVCYFRDMLMILNMVRAGVLGDLLHCEGGYQHDSRAGCFDEKGDFDEKAGDPSQAAHRERTQLWYTWHALRRNGNLYPTHPVGPIAQYLNVDRGDRFTHLVSMSSKSLGLNYWVRDKFGPQHPNAKKQFALGDINTTLIKTHNGCTVTLYYDTQAPRPYDLGFRIQGTKGIYQMARDSVYIEGLSPQEKWEPLEVYRQKYEHPLWKKLGEAAQQHGHGGSDYLTLYQFIKAVRDKAQPEQDVYDAATWSVISPLSEKSVAEGDVPIEFPDFTRGAWKTRTPVGIVED